MTITENNLTQYSSEGEVQANLKYLSSQVEEPKSSRIINGAKIILFLAGAYFLTEVYFGCEKVKEQRRQSQIESVLKEEIRFDSQNIERHYPSRNSSLAKEYDVRIVF